MKPRKMLLAMLVLLVLFAAGCATKKYVRKTVDERLQPVENKVTELEETSRRNTQDIKALDTRLTAAVDDARSRADRAQTSADQASQRALQAQEGVESVRQTEKRDVAALNDKIGDLDNYRAATTVTVLFKVNRSDLTAQGKTDLDALAAQVKDGKGYLIEIQGFTDSTGSSAANRALSQKRADAVRAYLAEQHNIPIFRMSMLGLGDARPVGTNKNRSGRAQNRRVEVRLLVNSVTGTVKTNG